MERVPQCNDVPPAGNDGPVDGDLVVALEEDRGREGGEMAGQIGGREAGFRI